MTKENGETKRALILFNLNKIDSINLTFGYAFSENIVKELTQKLSQFTSQDIKLYFACLSRVSVFMSQIILISKRSENFVSL